jgi:hypothetical protein
MSSSGTRPCPYEENGCLVVAMVDPGNAHAGTNLTTSAGYSISSVTEETAAPARAAVVLKERRASVGCRGCDDCRKGRKNGARRAVGGGSRRARCRVQYRGSQKTRSPESSSSRRSSCRKETSETWGSYSSLWILRAGRPRGCTRQTPQARLSRDPRLPGVRNRPSGARLDRRGDYAKVHDLAFATRGCKPRRRHERPEDVFALEDLSIITKHSLVPGVTAEEELRGAFTCHFGT